MLKTLNIAIGNLKKVQQHHIKKKYHKTSVVDLYIFQMHLRGMVVFKGNKNLVFGRLPDIKCLDHGAKYTITNK